MKKAYAEKTPCPALITLFQRLSAAGHLFVFQEGRYDRLNGDKFVNIRLGQSMMAIVLTSQGFCIP